jgi:hypothetical protein
LEGHLGKTWAKKVKPTTLEDLGALVALLRPGCISGDTQITVRIGPPRPNRPNNFMKVSMKELYEQFHRQHPSYRSDIVSLDEQTHTLVRNKVLDVIHSGKKKVFKPLFRCVDRKYKVDGKFHNLECTDDHPLLTTTGWKQLKDIQIGERVAVITTIKNDRDNTVYARGEKYFRNRCFQYYEYHCVMCNWLEGSLDVNHLSGNRKTNNHPDNALPNTQHIQWAKYRGCKPMGTKDTYDITVQKPNHNFIAGNVVVHNCIRAMSGDPPKSMTQRYCDRKHLLETVEYLHPSLEPLLDKTYGVLTYQ